MKKTHILQLFLPLLIAYSCSNLPSRVKENMKLAGTNKSELEKVIEHYRHDEEKLLAAYFLIENMNDLHSRNGNYSAYHSIYDTVRNLYSEGLRKKALYKNADNTLTKLEEKHGPIAAQPTEAVQDIENITSELLINTIDLAFQAWKKNPWCKEVSFENFCEYVLPYRVHDEPLSDYRAFFQKEFSWLKDSMKNPEDIQEACLLINNHIAENFIFIENMHGMPYPTAKQMYSFGAGECGHRYFLAVSAMRSVGIPVAIDYSPQWNHWPGTHSWVALVTNHGSIPFNAGEPYMQLPADHSIPIGMKTSSVVFRSTFSIQENTPMYFEESYYNVPPSLRDSRILNVSNQYNYDMLPLSLDFDKSQRESTIYLGSYGYGKEIIAVDWMSTEDTAFKNIGQCGIYVPFHFRNNQMEFLSQPFILSCEDSQRWYSTPLMDKMDTAVITRKFDMQDSMLLFSANMVGGVFEASNSPHFSTADTIVSIAEAPRDFVSMNVNSNKKYRFLRFRPPAGRPMNLAELQIWDDKDMLAGKIMGCSKDSEFLSDNNIRTNYNAPADKWIGLDLGKPTAIHKIRYLPRNNFNIVEPGDIYELFYFDYGWKSLGVKKATANELLYKVPRYSLLLLKDLSKGKEERIFKYEGKQIFW